MAAALIGLGMDDERHDLEILDGRHRDADDEPGHERGEQISDEHGGSSPLPVPTNRLSTKSMMAMAGPRPAASSVSGREIRKRGARRGRCRAGTAEWAKPAPQTKKPPRNSAKRPPAIRLLASAPVASVVSVIVSTSVTSTRNWAAFVEKVGRSPGSRVVEIASRLPGVAPSGFQDTGSLRCGPGQ